MAQTVTHLCVFALDADTGAPLPRVPFYAEVGMRGLVEDVPDGPIDGRFSDQIEIVIRQADRECFADEACRQRMRDAIEQGLSRLLAQAARDQLAEDIDLARAFIEDVLRRARRANNDQPLGEVDLARLRRLIHDAIRAAANRVPLELAAGAEPVPIQWAHPMGILATDHVGYLSFDLRRLPADVSNTIVDAMQARRKDPQATLQTTLWLYPLVHDQKPVDALAQARFAHDSIVVRHLMVRPALPSLLRNAGFLAMQNPGLTDWRISPTSFATNPGSLVGADGCETLLPANIARHQFHFYQVIRLADVNIQNAVPEPLRNQVRLGVVHEYEQTWNPLGHSLGQISYSLPLAPGESVNLAVIDWTRRDETVRTEDTKVNEQLVHNQRRDRTITETVNAALREYQEGNSFMGGGALSAGGSGSFGPIGAAVGSAFSLGGASSSSSGSRDLTASTVQNLSDNISQASTSMREFQSTVVVRSTQSESQAIETRTVVNYNHSHSLTILYYEVLRHFRVVTSRTTIRPAVLVRMPPISQTGPFTAVQLLGQRYLLEPLLLDQKLAAAFDAAARIALGEEKLKREIAKWQANTVTIDPGAKSFTKLIAQFTTTGDDTSEPVFVVLVLHDGRTFEFQCDGAGDEGTSPEFEKGLPVPINWNQIKGIEVKLKDINTGGDWEESNILITMATAANERVSILADAITRTLDDAGGTTNLLPTIQPPPATTTTVGPKPQRADFISAEDDLTLQSLLSHFEANRGFYLRVLALRQNVVDQARQLDAIKLPGGQSSLLDQVENRALEVFGEFVAFASTNTAWNEAVRTALERQAPGEVPADERLVTLPGRGVFAEAKLGHCNASEVIDNTRFWDWQASPIPHLAPEIAPVQPVTPTPQQAAGTTPTPLPASLLNIVNPPAAPDPTGLAAALNVLATPNIFRDMSGRAEVADLLKKLSDNTISIAQAAGRAQEIQKKYGSADAAAGAGGGGGISGPRALPNQPSSANRDLHDMQNVLGKAQESGLVTPQQAQQTYAKALQQAVGGSGPGDPLSSGDLPQGEFATFVQAGRLNARVAQTLSDFMSAPLDSWRRMMARFTRTALDSNQLIGIVLASEANNLRAKFLTVAADPQPGGVTAATFFQNNTSIAGALGANINFVNRSGARSSFILLSQSLLDGTASIVRLSNNTRVQVTLPETLVHELTHLRNQDAQQMLRVIPDSAATVYIDPALAAARTAASPTRPTVEVLRSFVEEMSARHVHWRVRNEQLGAGGTLILQAEQLALAALEYFIELPAVFDAGNTNGYIQQINTRGTAARLQQVGFWLNLCQFYAFSDIGSQDVDAKQVFRLAGAWAVTEAGLPTPLQNTTSSEGVAPLLRDFV